MTLAPRLVLAAALAAMLAGCTESHLRMSPDFGEAVHQDVQAQIADPDAHYAGTPDPGSAGSRVSQAQDHYNKGEVIKPAATSTSNVAAGSGGASPH
jgi:hypothetical protein